jgi:hypothetical protein
MSTAYLTEAQHEEFIRDGFTIMRGLLPQEVVDDTRERLLAAMEIDPSDPNTWTPSKSISSDHAVLSITDACRTEEVDAVARELAGPDFIPRMCHSPYLETAKVDPPLIHGYIPIIRFPQEGPREFVKPGGYHIDGAHLTTLWPDKHYLVLLAYLSDVAEYGGATTVVPGSHRQVFEQWVREDHPGSTHPPALEYQEPIPVVGNAGDVIFMHYLMVHSGAVNRADHIRVALNSAVLPDPERPYQRKSGAPTPEWTPLDWTLRTDTL